MGVILPLLLCGTCFFGVFYAAMQGLKTAEVTKQAVRMAEADPHVQAALGSPLRVGRFVAGSIEISKGTGGGGEAALSIPLSGPKGSGTLEVRATRAQDAWTYSRLELVPAAGGPAINVLEDG